MKVVLLLLLFVSQGSALSIFCFENQYVSGRYVYFEYPTVDGAQGCCVGGAGSVVIYNPSNRYYLWYNCPATTVTFPLQCHTDTTCSSTNYFFTQTNGADGVDQCCLTNGYASFNVPGHDVCFRCAAPMSPPAVALNMPQNTWSGATKNSITMVSLLVGCLVSLLAK